MKGGPRESKKRLLSIAQQVAAVLKRRVRGTNLRVRSPGAASGTNTDGWAAGIGGLGQIKLQVWLDRFAGDRTRTLWACLHTENPRSMTALLKRVRGKLEPVRTITNKDTNDKSAQDRLALVRPLARAHRMKPVLEQYSEGARFLGIYKGTPGVGPASSRSFVQLAAAFLESVARTSPTAAAETEELESYPSYENRKQVVNHLRRERSRRLATARKAMDKYACQVCGLRFADRYGTLGEDFAEAHHRVPLSALNGRVRTKVEDLATVCANCHRMLHKMEGRRRDVEELAKRMRACRAKRSRSK